MLPRKIAVSLAWKPAALVGLIVILLFTQPGLHGETTTGNTPTFFRNFYLTGDTLVFGKGLKNLTPQNGVVKVDLTTDALPDNATAVAAYLYFAHVVTTSTLSVGLTNAKFRGQPITSANATQINPQGTSACWSQGGATGGEGTKRMSWYRVDALPYFDRDVYGRPIINGSHSLQLVSRSNNSTPVAEGAGLVIVYKSPSDPFRGIVIYDGGFVIDQGHNAVETAMHGYYQAETTGAQMSLTVLATEGQNNFKENLRVTGGNGENGLTLISDNPFTSTGGTEPSWDNPRFDLTGVSGIDDSAFVTVRIDNDGLSNFDCVNGGSFVLGTTLQDQDGDGLLDKWEDSTAESDPNGKPLPDLKAMGADKTKPDIFIEMAATYETQQYTSGAGAVTPHNHLPNPYVLKKISDALLKKNPISGVIEGVIPHFDVGPLRTSGGITGYFDRPGYGCPTGDNECLSDSSPYLVPTATQDGLRQLARGGELIHEKYSDPQLGQLGTCLLSTCQFPDYPGTIGWKFGLERFRDQFEGSNGEHLYADLNDVTYPNTLDEKACLQNVTNTSEPCRRRFDRGLSADANDRNRFAMFHFGLYAHYIGESKSNLPCLNKGTPTGFNPPGACTAKGYSDNPDYHTPRTISGRGDLSGGDYLETLGGWGNNFTGPEFVQASTTVHELGHNFWLTHRGILFGESPTYTLLDPVELERNCNPNYLSSMSYLFQVQGLRKLDGIPRINFSATQIGTTIDENQLPLGLGTLDYVTSWYAPLASAMLAGHTVADIATKHCDGSTIQSSDYTTQMVRITGMATNTAPGTSLPPAPAGTVGIDWNGDLNATNDYHLIQDVTFNGIANNGTDVTKLLVGNSDWPFVKVKGLQQLASRRTAGGLSLNGQDNGGQDNGGQDNGGQDNGGQDNGGQDNGGQDNGGQDNGGVDQDFATATAFPVAAHSFAASYVPAPSNNSYVHSTWIGPIVKDRVIDSYLLYKTAGTQLNSTTFANKVLVKAVPPSAPYCTGPENKQCAFDEPKPRKGTWIYWVIVKYVAQPASSPAALSDNSNISNPEVVVP
jgi:hypothetical protein